MVRYLRPMVALALTGVVSYLALQGSAEALSAVTSAFSVLLGALWGERAALKVPGEDKQ